MLIRKKNVFLLSGVLIAMTLEIHHKFTMFIVDEK